MVFFLFLVFSTSNDLKAKGGCKMSVYKIIELVGTSEKSWEDAVGEVVATASKTLKDLRIAEVKELDAKIEDGKVVLYRAKVKLSFKYHD